MTLRNAAGTISSFKVDPSVQRFQEVKQGDDVVLRYTEAFASELQKP